MLIILTKRLGINPVLHENRTYSSPIVADPIEFCELLIGQTVAHAVHGSWLGTAAISHRRHNCSWGDGAVHGEGWVEPWRATRPAGHGARSCPAAPHIEGFAHRRTCRSFQRDHVSLALHEDTTGRLHLCLGNLAPGLGLGCNTKGIVNITEIPNLQILTQGPECH